jgi:hypothetical protein
MKMTSEEIRAYAERNNFCTNLDSDELDHVARLMGQIQRWYYEDYPLGDFLTAVVHNDFMGAVFHADDVNIKALKLYAWFLTWNIPGDWREKTERGAGTGNTA